MNATSFLPRRRLLLLAGTSLVLGGLSSGSHAAAAGCTSTWDGGSVPADSNWETKENWSGDTLPGSSSDVCLPAGPAVILGSDVTVHSITTDRPFTIGMGATFRPTADSSLTGATILGALGGSGTTTLLGTTEWSGGLVDAGTAVVPVGSTLNASGTMSVRDGHGLQVQGQMSLADATTIYSGDSSTLEVSGTLALSGSASVFGSIYGTNAPLRLHSTGTISHTGTGTSTINALLDNDGTLSSAQGIIAAAFASTPSGSTTPVQNGTWSSSGSGSVVLQSGPVVLGPGPRLDHATEDGADLLVPLGTTASANALTLTSGTVTIDGALRLDGSSTWAAGVLTGSGTTTVTAGSSLALTPSAAVTMRDGQHLVNAGSFSFGAGALLYSGDGSELNNSGTISLAQGSAIFGNLFSYPGPALHLINSGMLTGTGDATVDTQLSSSGSVISSAGSLGVTSEPGKDLLQSGTFSSTGAGDLRLQSGPLVFDAAATWDRVHLVGADVTLLTGAHVLATGLNAESGTVSGTGLLDVVGDSTWSGGQMSGAGTTRIAAGATLQVPASAAVVLRGRNLHVVGTLALGNAASLYSGEGAALVNDGTVQLDDALIAGELYGSPALRFDNVGSLRKPTGTGQADMVADFRNTGSVSAAQGNLQLSNYGTLREQTGSFTSFAPGHVVFQGAVALGEGAHLVDIVDANADLRLSGTVFATRFALQPGGTVSGDGDLVVDQGMVLNGGRLSGPGALVVPAGETVTVSGSDTVLSASQILSNDGLLQVTDGNLVLNDGAFVDNAGTLDLQGTGTVYGSSSVVYNVGTLKKTAGGSTRIDALVDNRGSIRSTAGILSLVSLRNLSGSGADSALTGGNYVAEAGGTLDLPPFVTDAASVVLDGSTSAVTAAGQPLLTVMQTVAPAGRLRVRGGATLAGSTLSNRGVVDVKAASFLQLTALGQRAGTLDAEGTVTVSSALDLSGGVLRGTGTVAGDVVASGGSIDPGVTAVPGTLTITGALSQQATSGLTVDVAFPTSADRLDVHGTATLAGLLNVRTAPGIVIPPGTSFGVLTSGARTGTFSGLTGTPGGSATYIPVYDAAGVTLAVSPGTATAPVPAQPVVRDQQPSTPLLAPAVTPPPSTIATAAAKPTAPSPQPSRASTSGSTAYAAAAAQANRSSALRRALSGPPESGRTALATATDPHTARHSPTATRPASSPIAATKAVPMVNKKLLPAGGAYTLIALAAFGAASLGGLRRRR